MAVAAKLAPGTFFLPLLFPSLVWRLVRHTASLAVDKPKSDPAMRSNLPEVNAAGMQLCRLAIIKYSGMTKTALHQRLIAGNARIGIYSGAETVLAFGDPSGELHSLNFACGLFDLNWRARIVVTGKDRVRWLNGMLTNNVRDLPLNHGNYNFLL